MLYFVIVDKIIHMPQPLILTDQSHHPYVQCVSYYSISSQVQSESKQQQLWNRLLWVSMLRIRIAGVWYGWATDHQMF